MQRIHSPQKTHQASFLLVVSCAGLAALLSHQPVVSQETGDASQMMKVAACMAEIDPAEMDSLHEKGEALQGDIQKLCKAGNRAAAIEKARQFGLSMASNPAIKAIRACTDGMKFPQQTFEISEETLNEADICSFAPRR